MGIVDMHCHLLFGVDDGAKNMEDSIAMLDAAVEQGITDIILTPHYRHGMFAYPVDEIKMNFGHLLPEATKRGIRLFLGCEYHVNSRILDYLENGRCLTLADSEYVLAEYAFDTPYRYIADTVEELVRRGYIPVVAHVERYECMLKKPMLAEELQDLGALIQVDADAILGLDGFASKRCVKKLLKFDLIDIVASDSHDVTKRANHMKECFLQVGKKYGSDVAEKLFVTNPGKIIRA